MRTTVQGKELFVFVPPGYRWFESLYAALLNFRLPVSDMTLSEGALWVTFSLEDQQSLSLRVTERSPQVASWKNTQTLSIGYNGHLGAHEFGERIGGLFVKILARYETAIPHPIVGHGYIGPVNRPAKNIVEKMFPFVTVEESSANNAFNSEILVRLTSACNLNCPFCSRPYHHDPSDAAVLFLLETVSEMFSESCVSFTGGEPTLRTSFPKYVESALALAAIKEVQIQTNGIPFSNEWDPRIFQATERLSFFVSLHSLDPAIFQRCVGTADQLPGAKRGIQRILNAGHKVILNAVICKQNVDRLSEFVADVAREFKGANRPKLHFSTLICQEWNSEAPASLVRYRKVIPALQLAIKKMSDLGIPTDSSLSSTHASVPPCLLTDTIQRNAARKLKAIEHETGYEDPSKPWMKAIRCRSCAQNTHCLGVPKAYAQKYGLAELRPIANENAEQHDRS